MDTQAITVSLMAGCFNQIDEAEDMGSTGSEYKTATVGLQPFVLKKLVIAPPEEVARKLRAQIVDLNHKVATLDRQNGELVAQVADLAQMRQGQGPSDGHYTMTQFLTALTARLGRWHGWREAYTGAVGMTPGLPPVTLGTLRKWRKDDRVPEWAVDVIATLDFAGDRHPGSKKWTHEEELFLWDAIRVGDSLADIAARCTTHFGRPVSERNLKTVIARLRKAERFRVAQNTAISQDRD